MGPGQKTEVQSQGLLLIGRGLILAEHAADVEVLHPTAAVSTWRIMPSHGNKLKSSKTAGPAAADNNGGIGLRSLEESL